MTEKQRLVKIATTIADEEGIDFQLLCAICEIESSWNPYAIRYERDYIYQSRESYFAKLSRITEATENQLQKFSFGLCQVMGGTARFLKYEEPLVHLFDEETNLTLACRYLHSLSDKCATIADLVSAYNHGSPWHLDGETARYKNQKYVNAVNKAMGNY